MDIVASHDGVARFEDACGLPSQAVRDQRQRFFQPGVAGFALLEQAPEFGRRQAAANFFLERRALQ